MDRIFFGIDRFLFESNHRLKGKKVALLTNTSAITASIPGPRVPSRLALQRAGLHLTSLLINRHGLFLEGAVQPIPTTDPLTRLPIIDIPSQNQEELAQHFASIDAVVVDLPDTGIRHLSCLEDLGQVLLAATNAKVPVWILDRPNPIGSHMKWAEGPLQEKASEGSHWNLPVRHCLTIGELSRMWTHENAPGLDLNVVTLGGWNRRMMWPQLKLPYTPAHPHIVDFRSNLLAACTSFLSGLNLQIGLGTPWPFRVIGAPWINPNVLNTAISENTFRGVVFRPLYFRPNQAPYQGEICGGVMLHITAAQKFRPVETALLLLQLLHLSFGEYCEWQTETESGLESSPRAFNRMIGRSDIGRDIARMPSSRSHQIKTWTQARNWHGYVRDWILYT